MTARLCLSALLLSTLAIAANPMEGTWKLDPAKSTTSGIPKMKEATITYLPEGTGYRYQVKGTRENGEAVSSSFLYVKDGEDIKLESFPYGDTLVMTNGNSASSTGVFKRGGKKVGTVKRTISADGKVMTVNGNSVTADGKKITYTSVYVRQ